MNLLQKIAIPLLALPILVATPTMAETIDSGILTLQQQWSRINYLVPEADREALFKSLVEKAAALGAEHPKRPEPMIWEAIIRASYAGAMGGISSIFNAMPQMKKGRDLLLVAEKINPKVLQGAVYTTLGSFYYLVPGGFVGFGDKDKALVYLNKALKMAPNNIDANYFTGDFWLKKKQYQKAIPYLEKVLALPDVADRPVYSKGRKQEATEKLTLAQQEIQ